MQIVLETHLDVLSLISESESQFLALFTTTQNILLQQTFNIFIQKFLVSEHKQLRSRN